MHPLRSPWSTAGLQQQRQQKAHIHMETKQCSIKQQQDQRRNKKIKDFLEFNENENTTYGNLWHAIKLVLRGKLRALSATKKKLERAYTSNLTAQLKALEQKKADTPKRARNNQTQGRNRPNRNKKNH